MSTFFYPSDSDRQTDPTGGAAGRSRHPVPHLLILLALPLLLALPTEGLAQGIVNIGNDWVSASINTRQKTGRFWISSGPKKGGTRFLYHGDQSPQRITSNIVFRVERGPGQVDFYTNNPENFFVDRPQFGSDTADFLPFSDIRIKQDTVEIDYDLKIYDVTVRFVVEHPTTPYDNGADVLIEFEYHVKPFVSGGTIGVMLMLDGDNGKAEGTVGGSGDQTSIVTTSGYYDVDRPGYIYQPPFDSIPEFYHVGNFRYNPAYIENNRILPVHRLRGLSNAGTRLDPPDIFAIGNWRQFQTLAWNPYAVDRVGDVATALQWTRLAGHGKVRTAFGTNNEGRNNLYHCRDANLFADIRTVRLIEQVSEDGPYEYEEFDVEMWISNTGDYDVSNSTVRLETPIESRPSGNPRVELISPADQSFIALPGFTRKLSWKLRLNPNSNDTAIRLNFTLREWGETEFSPFLDACAPTITIRPFRPPPTDTLAPVIARVNAGRAETAFWDVDVFDRHPGFIYDTGLDEIDVIANPGRNFRLIRTPDPFAQCDVSETVRLRFEVVDTTRQARVIYRATDCNGNVAIDSLRYSPRPDPFTPTVVLRDSTGSFDPQNVPCNARQHVVEIRDIENQFFDRGDYGLGSVTVVSNNNFTTPVITNQRGEVGGEILDFDSAATIRFEVVDKLVDAAMEIRVTDYAGNDTSLFFSYCTIDDFLPPVINRTGNFATRFDYIFTDSTEWDRGLFEIRALEKRNVRFVWPDDTRRDSLPEISKGSRLGTIGVEIVDRCEPADLILEVRDLRADVDPANHITRDTIRYAGIPDTLAPNIVAIPGFDGTTYFFDVAIDDIHFPGGVLFECDRGLETIDISFTNNIRIKTPLARPDRYNASIAFEVIDTLAIDRTDTICVTAIDSVGNTTTRCTFWPTTPDRRAPVFIGRYDRSTGEIIGEATDQRENDRGLAEITTRNTKNLPTNFSSGDLRGAARAPVRIQAAGPDEPIAGELVLQDFYGRIINQPESSIHTVVIPFELPVVDLSITMPELVDAWQEIAVPIATTAEIEERLIRSISFTLDIEGPAVFQFVQASQDVRGAFTAIPDPVAGTIEIRYEPAAGEVLPAGAVLGTLRFRGETHSTGVERFDLRRIAGSLLVNDGADTTITIRDDVSDPLASTLQLPAPLLRIAGDSLTMINGDCNRALATAGVGKPSGLEILSVAPNVVDRARGTITIFVRDLPESGGLAEWIRPDGTKAATYRVEGANDIVRLQIPTPAEASSGLYFLRIRTEEERDDVRVMVVR